MDSNIVRKQQHGSGKSTNSPLKRRQRVRFTLSLHVYRTTNKLLVFGTIFSGNMLHCCCKTSISDILIAELWFVCLVVSKGDFLYSLLSKIFDNQNCSSTLQLLCDFFLRSSDHLSRRLRSFWRESNLWAPKLVQMKAPSRSKGKLSATVIIMPIY